MLYACDGGWWRRFNGVPDFKGLKVTQDRGTPGRFPDIRRVRCKPGVHEFLLNPPGEIGWGGNGGFHAINLALQWGSRAIIGIGFDMSLMRGYHWHGRHPVGMSNPKQATVDKWRQRLDAQKPFLDRIGAEFVIGSPASALAAYRKLPLERAIDELLHARAIP